jgi:hypothetical protein
MIATSFLDPDPTGLPSHTHMLPNGYVARGYMRLHRQTLVRPKTVRSYSTRGGTSAYTVRSTRPSSSNSRSCKVNMRGVLTIRGVYVGGSHVRDVQSLARSPSHRTGHRPRFAFDQAREAYAHRESAAHVGKVVICEPRNDERSQPRLTRVKPGVTSPPPRDAKAGCRHSGSAIPCTRCRTVRGRERARGCANSSG